MYRIEVRRDLCIGAGTCAVCAPGVFELDDEDQATVTDPAGADTPTVADAARGCPAEAIHLYDGADRVYPSS